MEDVSATTIADYVVSLGGSFRQYESRLRRSGMSGRELQDLDEDCLNVVLDSLRITNRLHRRKLLSVCRKQLQQPHHCQNDEATSVGGGSLSGHSLSLQAVLDLDNQSVVSQYSVGSKSTQRTTPPPSLLSIPQKARRNNPANTTAPPPLQAQIGMMETMSVSNAAEALGLLVKMENQKRLLRNEDRPSGPPLGRAVLCLTDVENSTVLWEADPIAMRHALNLHDEIIRELRAQHGGYEIDTEGDAFFLAFHTANDALNFALQLQERLREADWDEDILQFGEAAASGDHRGLRVRVGVHMGDVATTQNAVTGRLEYRGPTLERAKQIEGMAQGGQILVSEPTWEAASIAAQIVQIETTGVVRVLCGKRRAARRNSNGSLASHFSKASTVRSRRRSIRRGGSFNSAESRCSVDSDESGSRRSSVASFTSANGKRRRGRKPGRSKSMDGPIPSSLTAQERLIAMP